MKIAIGCDHAGYEYKETLKNSLSTQGHVVIDKGTYSEDSVDYPDFVHPVAELVNTDEVTYGILICGSGNGVAMTANKHQEIRAALCWNKELAILSRQHNNANILCIPARFIDQETAASMVHAFIDTAFENGRHLRRVQKMACSC